MFVCVFFYFSDYFQLVFIVRSALPAPLMKLCYVSATKTEKCAVTCGNLIFSFLGFMCICIRDECVCVCVVFSICIQFFIKHVSFSL